VKIFGWTWSSVGNGSFHYRLHQPLVEIARQGLAEAAIGPHLDAVSAQDADVVVAHGLFGHQRFTALGEMREWLSDRVFVYEHDDDYLGTRPDNPMFHGGRLTYEEYVARDRPEVVRHLQSADLITVSVPHLAEIYREHTDVPIVVLPNTIDAVLLEVPQPVRPPGERLRVGWAGSATHLLDWRACAAGVKYGLTKANAQMFMMGADFRPYLRYRDTEFLPWADSIDQYYLPMTTWHVALAPLVDEAWNRSKSPLKALEAAAFGIPVVAGDAAPYRDFVIPGETGFLCRSDDDWMRAIRALGQDEEMRREMGRNARAVAARHTVQEAARHSAAVYRQALEAKRGAAFLA